MFVWNRSKLREAGCGQKIRCSRPARRAARENVDKLAPFTRGGGPTLRVRALPRANLLDPDGVVRILSDAPRSSAKRTNIPPKMRIGGVVGRDKSAFLWGKNLALRLGNVDPPSPRLWRTRWRTSRRTRRGVRDSNIRPKPRPEAGLRVTSTHSLRFGTPWYAFARLMTPSNAFLRLATEQAGEDGNPHLPSRPFVCQRFGLRRFKKCGGRGRWLALARISSHFKREDGANDRSIGQIRRAMRRLSGYDVDGQGFAPRLLIDCMSARVAANG